MQPPLKQHFHLTVTGINGTLCLQLDYELEVSEVIVDEAEGRIIISLFDIQIHMMAKFDLSMVLIH